ncbi:50S ribosomal protein L29 [Candidatus Woesearchaeota archaeon]|nr:50S ribosomal protein L29 [Candidatus Woesearchaeota archaeon]
MKAKELRLMNESDTGIKLADMKKELMKINSQIAIGTVPKSPGKVREIKRTIAKILSINNEKEIKIKKQNKGGSKKE